MEKNRYTNAQNQYLCQLLGKQVNIGYIDDSESQGQLVGFDKYSLVLANDTGQEYMIFKHAIAVITPE